MIKDLIAINVMFQNKVDLHIKKLFQNGINMLKKMEKFKEKLFILMKLLGQIIVHAPKFEFEFNKPK